jgi:hypothetical protein
MRDQEKALHSEVRAIMSNDAVYCSDVSLYYCRSSDAPDMPLRSLVLSSVGAISEQAL